MSWLLNGVPLHPLLVHAVIVLVPLGTLAAVLAAVWPSARRKLGVVMPILVSVGAASAVLAVQAGEWLEERVDESDLLETHTSLGDKVLPWLAAFVVVAWLHWLWYRWSGTPIAGWQKAVPWVLAVALVAVAIASTYLVYLVGDSGAQAVWSGEFSR